MAQDLQLSGSVNAGGVLQFRGNRHEVGADEDDGQGGPAHIGQDDGKRAIQESDGQVQRGGRGTRGRRRPAGGEDRSGGGCVGQGHDGLHYV